MRIIAIDWSGAKRGAGKKIWAAEFRDDQPVEELITGRDREWIKNHLIKASQEETVVGLDFAFSFPAWFVQSQANSAQEMWAKVAEYGENWLRDCDSPFWGCKGTRRCDLGDKEHYRQTEQQFRIGAIQPKSVFQILGAGAVGTGSIRGIKMLHELKPHFAIWPFDGPNLPLIIEIWPRALTGKVIKSNEKARSEFISEHYPNIPMRWRAASESSEDAFDAVISACVMHKHRAEIRSLKPATDPTICIEGQIWHPSQKETT